MSKMRILLIVLLSMLLAAPALANSIIIDGDFSDWKDKASLVDPGGADDERSPSKADITEFRAHADGDYLYLLKAWDDTAFSVGVTAGITLKTATGDYYRIYTTATDDPGKVLHKTLEIYKCSDSSCEEQKRMCAGEGCIETNAGSSTGWEDPWSNRDDPDCTSGSGNPCNTHDTAVELLIPWKLFGDPPGVGQFIFLQFGSYPDGPAQAPKDDTGPNGIACKNVSGTFQCYRSTPTAVTLKDFRASSPRVPLWLIFVVMAIVAGIMKTRLRSHYSLKAR